MGICDNIKKFFTIEEDIPEAKVCRPITLDEYHEELDKRVKEREAEYKKTGDRRLLFEINWILWTKRQNIIPSPD